MSEAPEPLRDAPAAPQAAERELRDFQRRHEQRRRQLPRAILTGVIAGLVAVAFRAALAEADALRDALVARVHVQSWAWLAVVLFSATGGGLAVFLVRRFAPDAGGSGIPHVKAVLYDLRPIAWARVLLVKFAGGIAALGAGLALGREGPTIQMGAAIGRLVGGWFPCTARERRTLIAAGAGAGLAAAFNAPLAGLVFVLEELQRDFAPGVFATTLIASVIADIASRVLFGQQPVFAVPIAAPPPLSLLPVALVLGALAGVLGVVFNRTLLASLTLFARTPWRPAWINGALVGAGVGLVALALPAAVGSGHHLVERMLAGDFPLPAVAGLFVLRFALTQLSYGCGAPGGIFAPLLVLGAALGLLVGSGAAQLAPTAGIEPRALAVVGMAAYFTAIVRAPLTGIVLMVEMTGNYAMVLPLVVACLAAYGIADYLGDLPIYEALLQRDLLREAAQPQLDGVLLLDLTIAPGAPFDGRRIRELGLPPGAIITTLRRRQRDMVPTADLPLAAGDQISVLVAPEAAAALPLLRRGAGLTS